MTKHKKTSHTQKSQEARPFPAGNHKAACLNMIITGIIQVYLKKKMGSRAISSIKMYLQLYMSRDRDFQHCGMCDQQRLRPACAYAQSDQSLCQSLEYSISVTLLTEHLLEFLSLKGGCTDSPESTLVKIPHCWKSHVYMYTVSITRLRTGIQIQVD